MKWGGGAEKKKKGVTNLRVGDGVVILFSGSFFFSLLSIEEKYGLIGNTRIRYE